MVKKRIRLKRKYANMLWMLFIILLLYTLGISIYNIVKWKFDSINTNEQIKIINDKTDIVEVIDNKNTEIIVQKEEVEEDNMYWSYIKMSLIDVNFNELKDINKDVRGWIKVNGTNVNYPFVQTNNNEYYLTHAFDKTYNKAGWIFMDYRNKAYNTDKNVILYGHSRYDDTMFGSLSDTLKEKWYSNKNNHIIKLSTEKENTMWQIFSVYRIPTTSDYIQTIFNSDSEFKEFTDMLINRSIHDFNAPVYGSDRIITLSTCYNNDDKVVIHAKLIKREVK